MAPKKGLPMIQVNDEKVRTAIEIFIKIGFLFLVIYISYLIVKPFLPLILWGIILAVAFEPLVQKLEGRFGSRKKVVIGMTLVFIAALIVPAWTLSGSIIESAQHLMAAVQGNERLIPPPSEHVKEWPLIGDKLYALWESAHTDLRQAMAPFKEQIKGLVMTMISLLKGGFGTLLLTIASLIIAAAFLLSKEKGAALYHRFMRRILGEAQGDAWADMSVSTIRSVATGVVGVAVIQSALALPALLLMGVPLAPLWAIIIMFLTIIQLPALIIIGPIIAYVFSYAEGTPATIFAVYMLLVGASDGVLKPMLMGRGVDIPMLVILIGAIGGMMLMGMLGLFIGAVILALAYKLFTLWMSDLEETHAAAQTES
jgi:predicted PurR-regulated permease PerM